LLAEPKLALGRDSLRAGSPRRSRFGVSSRERRLVDLTGASWNQVTIWLRQVDAVMRAAQTCPFASAIAPKGG
jgi:hypothetical protein